MRGSYSRGQNVKIDDSELLKLFNKLANDGKVGRHNVQKACQMATFIIREETMDQAKEIKWKTKSNRAKSFRKLIVTNAAYKFLRVKSRGNRFWFRDKVDYKKPANKIAHLVERGWTHIGGKHVSGYWFRLAAFNIKKDKAMRVLLKALYVGMDATTNDKKLGFKAMKSLVGDVK